MSIQGFWGLQVYPGKRYTQTVSNAFMITMASLPATLVSGSRCSLCLQVDDMAFVLCSLIPGKKEQQLLNVTMMEGQKVSFCVRGENPIHLTGNYVFDDASDGGSRYGVINDKHDDLEVEDKVQDMYNTDSGYDNIDRLQGMLQKLKRSTMNSNVELLRKRRRKDKASPDGNQDNWSSHTDMNEFDRNASDINESDMDDEQVKKGDMGDEDSNAKDIDEKESDTVSAHGEDINIGNMDGLHFNQGKDDKRHDRYKPRSMSGNDTRLVAPVQSLLSQTSLRRSSSVSSSTYSAVSPSQSPPSSAASSSSVHQVARPSATASQPASRRSPEVPEKRTSTEPESKHDNKKPLVAKHLPNGLIVEDKKLGTGRAAKPGDKLAMHYLGKLTNGKVIDSNSSGPGLQFTLGSKQVIRGWDIGCAGMKAGGERRLTIPPALAYRQRGAPPDIPPNATLIFDVKLLEIKK